jgi:hypothetical protein
LGAGGAKEKAGVSLGAVAGELDGADVVDARKAVNPDGVAVEVGPSTLGTKPPAGGEDGEDVELRPKYPAKLAGGVGMLAVSFG